MEQEFCTEFVLSRAKAKDHYELCNQFQSGKGIQNADNLVLVGSPYAMLLYATCGNPEIVYQDPTFEVEDGAIQCYTTRFEDDEYLAEFRSPFNGKNNLGCLHNVYSEEMQRYFKFCPEILAVNTIKTDFESRNNGLTYWASVQKCA